MCIDELCELLIVRGIVVLAGVDPCLAALDLSMRLPIQCTRLLIEARDVVLVGGHICIVVSRRILARVDPIVHGISVIWVKSVELAFSAFLGAVDVGGLHEDVWLAVVAGDEVVFVDEAALEDPADVSVLEETGREQIRRVLEVVRGRIERHDRLRSTCTVT